jgi:hypothetical protein
MPKSTNVRESCTAAARRDPILAWCCRNNIATVSMPGRGRVVYHAQCFTAYRRRRYGVRQDARRRAPRGSIRGLGAEPGSVPTWVWVGGAVVGGLTLYWLLD